MKRREPITLFEHERLRIGERGFGQKHFERLVRWNEANGDKFFTIGHKAIKCTQYVGVVQVGDLAVQVLPKADRTGDADKWRQALLTMLRTVHRLPLTSTNETHLHRRHSSILDFFYDLYVQDVHGLVRRGLVKKYRRRSGNLTALKGRIDWPNHLRDNLLHKERFHVQHQAYDRDHLLHALLKQALGIVRRTTVAPLIAGRVDDVSWAFEEVTDLVLDRRALERIRLDRKT
ncbi:MAG TPA: restriction endonuclease, partial [Flavobacteriales bacterium]|nr:restriction endonuclease [Flavobacteriales bacterium]